MNQSEVDPHTELQGYMKEEVRLLRNGNSLRVKRIHLQRQLAELDAEEVQNDESLTVIQALLNGVVLGQKVEAKTEGLRQASQVEQPPE